MTWWHYLLLVNLYLLVFYSFYALLLRNETFFQLNRVYLIIGAALSFLIPCIQASWIKDLFITRQVQHTIYATVNPEFIYHAKPIQTDPLTIGTLFAVVYISGAVFLLCRFLLQLIAVNRLLHRVGSSEAVSFFNNVKIDPELPGQQIITEHEDVHVRQWHSADVIFIEAVMICNWFNPIVYLYRKAIKHVHEFIADKKAIEKGTSKTDYALLLLSQTFGIHQHQLTNNFFNKSLLKRRIIMLNKDKSKRRKLLKYGLSAPLFACMLVLSSATVNNSSVITIINKKTDQVFRIAPLLPVKPISQVYNQSIIISKSRKIKSTFPSFHKDLAVTVSEKLSPVDKLNALEEKSTLFTAVELSPTFPGGEAGFYTFLQQNLHYPQLAKNLNVQGKVYAQFVVEKDGGLSNLKIIRDPGAGLGDEAMRVLLKSPRWNPGIQNGRQVRVQYTVPVNFSLDIEPAQSEGHDTLRKLMSVISRVRLNGVAYNRDSAMTLMSRPSSNSLHLIERPLSLDSIKIGNVVNRKKISQDQFLKGKLTQIKILNIRKAKAMATDVNAETNIFNVTTRNANTTNQ